MSGASPPLAGLSLCADYCSPLAAGCSDGTVRTWRLGSERTSFDHISTLHGHNSRVSALRWSPTTDLLMSADVHTVSWLPKPQ